MWRRLPLRLLLRLPLRLLLRLLLLRLRLLLLLLQLLGLLLQLLELELELHRSGLLHSRLPGGGILCLVRVVQLRVRGLCGSEALWWCCRRRLLRGLKL